MSDKFIQMIDSHNNGLICSPDPIPDYTQSSSSYLLEDGWLDAVDVNRKSCFYRGALFAISLLGNPETRSQEEITNLARMLIHEAKHGLLEEKRNQGY